jgi:hypothetical protein
MIKVFKQLKASFFQWLSTGIFALLFVSCVSYYPTSYRAESVLAVTKAGDTIKLPISELRRQYNYNTYSDWQFYYGNNSWYLWSDWRLRYPSYNIWYNDWYRPYGRSLGITFNLRQGTYHDVKFHKQDQINHQDQE